MGSSSAPRVVRGLNFVGPQKDKVLSESSSSRNSQVSRARGGTPANLGVRKDDEAVTELVKDDMCGADEILGKSVQQMQVEDIGPSLNLVARGPCSRERVSMSSDYGLSDDKADEVDSAKAGGAQT
ncbi:Os01g0521101 [Oryza sativa Japonica Group]|uniref:Os01g0521101 protein n=1 Tax=Oryza sativa subsp. japonica TaxID=39947 RepID=A0A0P0V3D1_ORYSJ|nr:Os01g0521101 [Oryza sativa Japonica Group]